MTSRRRSTEYSSSSEGLAESLDDLNGLRALLTYDLGEIEYDQSRL